MASVPRFTFFHALDASWSFVMARQQFGFLRHGQPARDSELGAGQARKTHRWSRQAHHGRFVGGNCKNKDCFPEIFPLPVGWRQRPYGCRPSTIMPGCADRHLADALV